MEGGAEAPAVGGAPLDLAMARLQTHWTIADEVGRESDRVYYELKEMPQAKAVAHLRHAVQLHQECLAGVQQLLQALEADLR